MNETGFVIRFTRHSKARKELLFIRETDLDHPNTAKFFERVRADGGTVDQRSVLVEKLNDGRLVKVRDYRRTPHFLDFKPQSAFLRG